MTSVNINHNTQSISTNDLQKLLKLCSSTHFKSKVANNRTDSIENTCIRLFSKDSPNPIVITNENGELSTSYPSKIIIPQLEKEEPSGRPVKRKNGTPFNEYTDAMKLKDLMSKARVARCRARFPIPVILFKNKYICRSATLSSGAEIYGRSVIDYCSLPASDSKNNSTPNESCLEEPSEDDEEFEEAVAEDSPPMPQRSLNISDSSQMCTHVRNLDIKLLKFFSVKNICDLMLEKKKVKYGMKVTSSEKADRENRYSDFNIISLPYPGCEFFREYRDNSYCAEGLVYNWNQNFVDAFLDLPNCELLSRMLKVNLKEYRSWDVAKLTQNYLRLLIYFIRESDSSILIHCISGWDRTPLFMSLLRLTLWADGEIHKNLSAMEITYLTVAYDWFLFGHNLNDRLNKGEEIMFFCFQFLKFITDEKYSVNYELPKIDDEELKRKISVDSYTNGDDGFILEHIPHFGGSLTSLNSNGSLANVEPPVYYSLYQDSKHDDLYPSSMLSAGVEQLKITPNDSFSNSLLFGDSNSVHSDNLSQSDEMISTLTSSSVLKNSSPPTSKLSPASFNGSVGGGEGGVGGGGGERGGSYCAKNALYPHTKPVEIPNSNKNHENGGHSLCRSDSWQFVDKAGSIRDHHNMSNHFSSPDSVNSLRKDLSNSPLYNPNHFSITNEDQSSQSKLNSRKNRLIEVRSIFNSAYNSLNLNHNNGRRVTNLVDHFVGQIYSTRESPDC